MKKTSTFLIAAVTLSSQTVYAKLLFSESFQVRNQIQAETFGHDRIQFATDQGKLNWHNTHQFGVSVPDYAPAGLSLGGSASLESKGELGIRYNVSWDPTSLSQHYEADVNLDVEHVQGGGTAIRTSLINENSLSYANVGNGEIGLSIHLKDELKADYRFDASLPTEISLPSVSFDPLKLFTPQDFGLPADTDLNALTGWTSKTLGEVSAPIHYPDGVDTQIEQSGTSKFYAIDQQIDLLKFNTASSEVNLLGPLAPWLNSEGPNSKDSIEISMIGATPSISRLGDNSEQYNQCVKAGGNKQSCHKQAIKDKSSKQSWNDKKKSAAVKTQKALNTLFKDSTYSLGELGYDFSTHEYEADGRLHEYDLLTAGLDLDGLYTLASQLSGGSVPGIPFAYHYRIPSLPRVDIPGIKQKSGDYSIYKGAACSVPIKGFDFIEEACRFLGGVWTSVIDTPTVNKVVHSIDPYTVDLNLFDINAVLADFDSFSNIAVKDQSLLNSSLVGEFLFSTPVTVEHNGLRKENLRSLKFDVGDDILVLDQAFSVESINLGLDVQANIFKELMVGAFDLTASGLSLDAMLAGKQTKIDSLFDKRLDGIDSSLGNYRFQASKFYDVGRMQGFSVSVPEPQMLIIWLIGFVIIGQYQARRRA